MIYRRFKINKATYANLSKKDKSLLEVLERVVKDTAVIYELQLKEGFYPKGITKADLENAAKLNPEILSPFTFVQRNGGKLKAIPYHIHYAKYLQPISNKLGKAAELCTNQSFKVYLEARVKSLLDGSVKEAYKAWVNVKDSKLDFNIAPNETHLDKLLNIKRAYQSFVGIIDSVDTETAERYKETLYSSAKLSFSKYHSTEIARKGVNVFVEETPAVAGYPADVLSSGEHFPQDLDIALKHGARTVIYASQFALKFDKLYYPIFKIIFEKRFASKYSKELLLEATGLSILLYELGKQLHKFEDAKERLQELYASIDEANGFASGIEHSRHLIVKGLLSQEQLEAIMIIHIVWMITDWLLYKHNIAKQSHMIGNSILLNSYIASGALRESAGISWPNFSRIFFEIESIAYKLVYLLQKGSYKETEQFIKRNANLKIFERFNTLSNINKI